MRFGIILIFCGIFFGLSVNAQIEEQQNDSIAKAAFFQQIGNGYFPTKYFDFDLKYLVKFNQYEGLRNGIGGKTNRNFSEVFRLNGYFAYGFRDKASKYGIGGGFRLSEAKNTWINVDYINDLQETGSSAFLTDSRFFSFFEPRLVNISLFHQHITKSVSVEHQLLQTLLTETEVASSRISPTYNYTFVTENGNFSRFDISTVTIGAQWSPFSKFENIDNKITEVENAFPKFTFQFTKGLKDVFNGDFNFGKIDFKTNYEVTHKNESLSSFLLVAGLALGDVPLTHLYHAYPNQINKSTILQRFTVAGINSFETMYFNEFFSDRFITLQTKHFFKRFQFGQRFRPQLVLITRHAIGDMNNINRHQGIEFNTLDQIFNESGFEINKILFGFGLSFAYRYGAYHLPEFEDNFSFKFTFNLSL